jgi:hypothetical protein
MSDEKTTYEFEVDGKTFSVPAFSEMPTGALRKARKADNDMDRAFVILEEALGLESDALAALDKMSLTDFGKWLEGWTQGASLGESSGSGK